MSTNWEGSEPTKQKLKLDGKKVIIKDISCFDGSSNPPFIYREEVIYHFRSKENAKEYYYKKK